MDNGDTTSDFVPSQQLNRRCIEGKSAYLEVKRVLEIVYVKSPIQAPFHGKILGQFFVPTSQKMRLCVGVVWRHSCSYVVLPIDMYI